MNRSLGNRKFRRAFIAQNTGHDFSGLKDIADDLVFITTGYEEEDNLQEIVLMGLQRFNPSLDVIVPVGNVFVNILLGTTLSHLKGEFSSYQVALFRDKEYHTRTIQLGESDVQYIRADGHG